MNVKQPDEETIVRAVQQTLHLLYGEPVTALLIWQPPGTTAINLASNGERHALIEWLRQAADNIELGLLPHYVSGRDS